MSNINQAKTACKEPHPRNHAFFFRQAESFMHAKALTVLRESAANTGQFLPLEGEGRCGYAAA